MFQDSKGRLWLGTGDDLLCFDGVRFYSMRAFGFPREPVVGIAEDSDGGIWVATFGGPVQTDEGEKRTGGLYRYQSGHVERISPWGFASVVSLAPGVMLATMTTDHHLEFNDLYLFRKQGNAWKGERLLARKVGNVRLDHQGNALFPCPAGWCELSRQELLDWPNAGTQPAQHSFSSNGHALHAVLRDRFGCVWGRSDSETFYGCDASGNIAHLPPPWGGPGNYALEESPDGRILSLSSSDLVYGRRESPSVVPGDRIPLGVANVYVTADGTIWLSGYDGKLYQFLSPLRLEYWNEEDGSSYQTAIMRIGDSMFSGGQGGVFRLDADRRHWVRLPGSQSLGQINALAGGPGETLYAAGFGTTVSQLTTTGQVLASSRVDDFALSLTTDGTGQLWMGAGRGVSRVNRHGNTLDVVYAGFERQSSAVQYDSLRKTIWAFDDEQIVGKHTDRTSAEWLRIGQRDGLTPSFGFGLAVGKDGDLWTAVAGNEFSHVENPEGSPGHPLRITIFANPPGTNANFIGSDQRGWVWRCTNIEDLYVANAEQARAGDWLRLGAEDGIPSRGGGRGSFYNDRDGSVWYTSSKSIIHFSPPDDFLTSFPVPKVFYSGYTLGPNAPAFADATAPLRHGEDLVLHLGSLQFERRNALRLRWRLLPEQSNWQASNDLDLHLGKLHWGRHKLQMQAQMRVGSAAGPWSDVTEQSFEVMVPVWLRWPALCEFSAALVALLLGFRQWRKKLRERAGKILPELNAWRLEALSSELSNLEGTRLDGRFAVGELLARGGFASVLNGSDMAHGSRPCAIKIFRQELRDKKWMERRFKQEVAALERINHPNVVDIYGSGQLASGAFYLVMEFVDGETLRERFQAGKLDIPLVVTYLRELGSALQAIHAQDICHRDLKPENVMLRRQAEPGHELVLIDFSIAIVKDPDETMFGLSRAAGTLNYMAPEQAIGYADTSTDIYSLAKILIEMLTGQRLSTLLPDASMDLPECVRELLRGLNIRLSPVSIELIAQALEFDPARRPKDAYSFASSIADDLAE
jgi:tRNA A-37 threonylcarbamoyl transferase component Bud32/ligand-binding sensor domain-containing protein